MIDGALQYKWSQYARSRSQDLEPFYHDAGQFYFYRCKSFLNYRTGGSFRTIPILTDEIEVQDIDNLSDWELAEIKYRMLLELGKLT